MSGLEPGPIAFLDSLAPRYVNMLRRVFVRTGYDVDQYFINHRLGQWDRRTEGWRLGETVPGIGEPRDAPLLMRHKMRNVAVSMALMNQAWPNKYGVFINKDATVSYPADEDLGLLPSEDPLYWPASHYHLWKMIVSDTFAKKPKFEFRRIEWGGAAVKNLGVDGRRATEKWVSTLDQET